jgi:hypothetical protein
MEEKKINRLLSDNKASTFAVALFFLFMFFAAFAWFFLFSSDGIVTMTNEAMSPVRTNYNTSSHIIYDGVDAFVSGIQTYMLVIGLLGVFVAGIVYTIRKRAEDPLR